MTAIRLALRDLTSDWKRSAMNVGAIVPIVAAYLILVAIAGGLLDESRSLDEQNIVLLSPNALDPASGRLDPSVLDLVTEVGGNDISAATPMIFRPIRMDDRVVQLRAAPQDTWEQVHGLTLLRGAWPEADDDIAITEGIAVATEWTIGTRAEIFGTTFTVSALLRAPGTKFASVWMPFDRADRLFEGQSGFQMVTITPRPGTDPGLLLDRFEQVAGSQYSVYFESDLASLQTARGGAAENLAAISTIVGIAALAFGGFNLAALTLVERRRDLGIARTLGFSTRAVAAVTIIRSLVLAAAGFVIGAAAAVVVLSATAASTIRSFVFEPALPPLAWAAGAIITLGMSALGTWMALRGPARTPVGRLLEAR